MDEKNTVQYKATELKDGETKESLLREADGLRMQIRHHEYQYYVLDAPEISVLCAGRARNQRCGI